MRRLLLTAAFALSASPAFAFINIEAVRNTAKEGFNGKGAVGVKAKSGNSEVFESMFSNLLLWQEDKNEYLFLLNHKYGESEHQKNAHQGQAHLRYARTITEWKAFESFAQAEFDEFRAIELRQLYGAGMRWGLARGDRHTLNAGTGAFYEIERKDVGEESHIRGNLYLSDVFKLTEALSGHLVAYYQPAFDRWSDFRGQADAGLTQAIYKNLTLALQAQLVYDEDPPPGVKRYDLTEGFELTLSY